MSDAPDTAEATEAARLARRVPEDVVTDRNFGLVTDLFEADAVEHTIFGRTVRGAEAIREMLEGYGDAFPDFEARVEDVVASGDTVAMRVTLSGTHEGEFMGFEPTGESFEVANMAFTRVTDGRIAERWVLPDAYGMLEQLGVLPPIDELEPLPSR